MTAETIHIRRLSRLVDPPCMGVRIRRLERLVSVASPIEETYWTAKEWSARTRVPYRTILGAVARGELEAVRPSGRPHGCVLISESGWARWMKGVRLQPRQAPRLGRSAREVRSLSDLALG